MHGHNVATPPRPRRPEGARAAVPARGAARGGAACDRRRVLPAGARAARGAARDAHERAGRGQRRSARAVRARDRRALERRRADAARDRRRDRGAARGDAVPGRPRVVRAAAEQRRRHGRADRGQRRDGRLRAGGVPARDRRARGDLRAGVERVRAHHHDVARVPDAARERPVPRRARHRLPRRVHGRRRRPRLDDDRSRGLAVPAQHRRPARGRDHQDGVRPARALRLLHRRVGGAVAVAEPRRAPRLLGRPGRRDRARRQGHVPARRHPQRRRPRPRST